jgi:hypothetical protein
MQTYVNIGANIEFRLSEAVLVYRGGGNGAFASLHQVKQAENGIPYLTPGEALTTAFLRSLAQGLGTQVKPEILPSTIRTFPCHPAQTGRTSGRTIRRGLRHIEKVVRNSAPASASSLPKTKQLDPQSFRISRKCFLSLPDPCQL